MAKEFFCKDFDDCMFKLSLYTLETFKCNTSAEEDITINCDSTTCPLTREMAAVHPKKMKQLRALYVEESELDRCHKEYVKQGESVFKFKNVQHEYDHIKGGCLTNMIIRPEQVTVTLRASVIPWNLQFDLVMIEDLLKALGADDRKIVFKIGYIRPKVIHSLLWFLKQGWTPEQLCEYQFGRACIAAYGRAKTPKCKWKNWIRFADYVDKLRAARNIPELIPILRKWESEHPDVKPQCAGEDRPEKSKDINKSEDSTEE